MPKGTEQVNGRIRLTPFTHSLVHSFLHSFIDPVNVYWAASQGQALRRALGIQWQTRHGSHLRGSQELKWETGQRSGD